MNKFMTNAIANAVACLLYFYIFWAVADTKALQAASLFISVTLFWFAVTYGLIAYQGQD